MRTPTKGQGWLPRGWASGGLSIPGDYPGCFVCSFLGESVFSSVLKGMKRLQVGYSHQSSPVLYTSLVPLIALHPCPLAFSLSSAPLPLLGGTPFGEDDLGGSHFDCSTD